MRTIINIVRNNNLKLRKSAGRIRKTTSAIKADNKFLTRENFPHFPKSVEF